MNIIMVYQENLSFPGTNPQQGSKFPRTECRQSSCETSPVTGSDEMQLYLQVSESLSKQETILLDSFLSSHKHKNRRNGPHKFLKNIVYWDHSQKSYCIAQGCKNLFKLPQNYGSKMILVGRNLTINRFLKFQELNHFHCK